MKPRSSNGALKKVLQTGYGSLFHADCRILMDSMDAESVDLIFADPPFNLNKSYPSKMNDDLDTGDYLAWQESWLNRCVRVLKPGGSLFVWNLPKWNISAAAVLNKYLTFRHWIAVDIKYRLPIKGRLYPSHYSLLYFCKGERPSTFHPDRLPMDVCPRCAADLKDYGGYKDKMNPAGVNLGDVWHDIPPVRHAKYKRRKSANELSVRLLDRVIEMASDEGHVVFDPFGGSGTTFVVAEIKKRNWIGSEIGGIEDILHRFKNIEEEKQILKRIRENYNSLFTKKTLIQRKKNSLWTSESVRSRPKRNQDLVLFKAI